VRDEHERDTSREQLAHPRDALLLESDVADAQHFVDEEDVRVEVSRNRKPEAGIHARGIPLDRCVDEFLDAGKVDNRVELARNLGARHSHDRALQIDVLAARQIGVKAGGDLDQRTDASVQLNPTARGSQDLGEELQDGRLAGAVGPDDAERFSRTHLERDVTHRPEFFVGQSLRRTAPRQARHQRRHEIAQAVVALATAKFLPDPLEDDRAHLEVLRKVELRRVERQPGGEEHDD